MSKVERAKCPYCGELMRDNLAETFISGKGVSFNDVCLNFKCKREVWVEIVPRAIVSKIEVIDDLGHGCVEPEGGFEGAKHFYEGVTGDKLKRAQEEARKLLGLNEDGGMADDAKFNFSTKDGHVNVDSKENDWDTKPGWYKDLSWTKVDDVDADSNNVDEKDNGSGVEEDDSPLDVIPLDGICQIGGGGDGVNSSFSFKASERLKGAEELVDPDLQAALDGC